MTSSLQPVYASSVGQPTSFASFDFHQRNGVVFGCGTFGELGRLSKELGGQRVLLVTDAGLRRTGYSARAEKILREAGLQVAVFDEVQENPTSNDVDRCVAFAKTHQIDLIVGLGGGSSIDCERCQLCTYKRRYNS